jgi:hypothetical protein
VGFDGTRNICAALAAITRSGLLIGGAYFGKSNLRWSVDPRERIAHYFE